MGYGSSGGAGVNLSDSSDNSVTIDENKSSLESFSEASNQASSKLTLMSKFLIEQEAILKKTRKQWKLLTGGIVGAFYSIAKLSPLFASYISEFGGVLGYVYDTAIIPWSDAIENLLDIMWGGADKFDGMSEGSQKFIGAVLMGLPIIAGLLVSLAGMAELMILLSQGAVVQGIISLFEGFSTGAAFIGIAIAAVLLFVAHWLGLTTVWSDRAKEMRDKMGVWKDDLVAIFNTLKEIAGKILDKFAPNLVTNLSEGYEKTKTWVQKIVAYIYDKLYGVIDFISPLNNIMKGTSAVRDKLDWVNDDLLGGWATGGTVTQDGLYKLHQGERVTSSTMNNNSKSSRSNYITISPQITISGGAGSSMDVRKLAADLSRYWLADIQKVVGSGHR